MNKTGEIVRVGQDWGLAEWYPGMRKPGRIVRAKMPEELEEDEKQEKSEETKS
jgi:hypothetical protein